MAKYVSRKLAKQRVLEPDPAPEGGGLCRQNGQDTSSPESASLFVPAACDLRAACFSAQFVVIKSAVVLAYPRARGSARRAARRAIIDMAFSGFLQVSV